MELHYPQNFKRWRKSIEYAALYDTTMTKEKVMLLIKGQAMERVLLRQLKINDLTLAQVLDQLEKIMIGALTLTDLFKKLDNLRQSYRGVGHILTEVLPAAKELFNPGDTDPKEHLERLAVAAAISGLPPHVRSSLPSDMATTAELVSSLEEIEHSSSPPRFVPRQQSYLPPPPRVQSPPQPSQRFQSPQQLNSPQYPQRQHQPYQYSQHQHQQRLASTRWQAGAQQTPGQRPRPAWPAANTRSHSNGQHMALPEGNTRSHGQQMAVHDLCSMEKSKVSPFIYTNLSKSPHCKIRLTTEALIDTGASKTIISEKIRSQLRLNRLQVNRMFKTVDNSEIEGQFATDLYISLNGVDYEMRGYVLENCPYDLIIGADFLIKYNCKIDLKSQTLDVNGNIVYFGSHSNSVFAVNEVTVPPCTSKTIEVYSLTQDCNVNPVLANIGSEGSEISQLVNLRDKTYVEYCNTSPYEVNIGKNSVVGSYEIMDSNRLRHLLPTSEESEDYRDDDSFEEIKSAYADVFSTGKYDLGRTALLPFKITTTGPPIRSKPYRYSPLQREEINSQVDKMLENQIISESISDWSSPVTLAKKSDGSWRFCIDYRRLNSITERDNFPMPNINDTLDKLGGSKVFSKLDLASGYWQLEVSKEDRHKTAFVTSEGQYEFNVLPFGLTNAPGTFNRLMSLILRGHQRYAMSYLDDIIIFSKSMSEHKDHIKAIFNVLRQVGLKIKGEKCEFFCKEVDFLGYVVCADGVKTDPKKLEAIRKIPYPRNVKEVRSFLGLASYYRRFIENFSKIAEPLNKLTRKGVSFHFEQSEKNAVDKLKDLLANSSILAYPDFGVPFIITTDASCEGIGAVLSQEIEGVERPIAFASRALLKAERNYSTIELECLGIVYALLYFRNYVYGYEIKIRTDHKPLQYLLQSKHLTSRLSRWAMKVSEFNVTEIDYKKGELNTNADALSRLVQPCKDAINLILEDHDGLQLDHVSQKQREDECLNTVIKYLRDKKWPDELTPLLKPYFVNIHLFVLSDGVLYRTSNSTAAKCSRPDQLYLVIPSSFKTEVLRSCHGEPVAGHFGVQKTLERIRSRYYWPTLAQDVKNYCDSCIDCQTRKTSRKTKLPMQGILTFRPFEIVGTDFMGPFKQTKSGNKYIMIITDYFTKWTEAYAVPSCDAKTTARAFIDGWCTRYGPPEKLLSDQGANYMSHLVDEVLNLTSTTHLRTAAYHPQTNGQSERTNQVLKTQLSMYVGEKGTDWDEYLQLVMFAYRTAEHTSTKFTPYEALFGRQAVLFQDVSLQDLKQQWGDISEYVKDLAGVLERNTKVIRENLSHAQEMTKKYYDRNVKVTKFEVGDFVLLRKPPNLKSQAADYKLQHKYEGPFRVLEVKSDHVYKILNELTGKVQNVNVSRLKLFRDVEKSQLSRLPEITESSGQAGSDKIIKEVEKVLDKRVVTNRNRQKITEYLIKWKDMDDTYNQWVKACDIQAPRLVEEFENKMKSNSRQPHPNTRTSNNNRPQRRNSLCLFSILNIFLMLLCVIGTEGRQNALNAWIRDVRKPAHACDFSKPPLVASVPDCRALSCLRELRYHPPSTVVEATLFAEKQLFTIPGVKCRRERVVCSYIWYFASSKTECRTESIPVFPETCRLMAKNKMSDDGELARVSEFSYRTNNKNKPEWGWLATHTKSVTNTYVYFVVAEATGQGQPLRGGLEFLDTCFLNASSCPLKNEAVFVSTATVADTCEIEPEKNVRCSLAGPFLRCSGIDLALGPSIKLCNSELNTTEEGIYVALGHSVKLSNRLVNDLPLMAAHLQYFEDKIERLAKISSCETKLLRCREEEELYAFLRHTNVGEDFYSSGQNKLYYQNHGLILYFNCTDVLNYTVSFTKNCSDSLIVEFSDGKLGFLDPYTFHQKRSMDNLPCDRVPLVEVKGKVFSARNGTELSGLKVKEIKIIDDYAALEKHKQFKFQVNERNLLNSLLETKRKFGQEKFLQDNVNAGNSSFEALETVKSTVGQIVTFGGSILGLLCLIGLIILVVKLITIFWKVCKCKKRVSRTENSVPVVSMPASPPRHDYIPLPSNVNIVTSTPRREYIALTRMPSRRALH